MTTQLSCVAYIKAPLVLFCTLAILALGASSASAATPGPGYTIDSFAIPTHFSTAHNVECATTLQDCGVAFAISLRSSWNCDDYA